MVDNKLQSTFSARAGELSAVTIQAGTGESYNVKVQNNATGVANPLPGDQFSMKRVGNNIILHYRGVAPGQEVSLQILNIKGELVANFKDVANKQVSWSPQAGGTCGEIYIARVVSGQQVLMTNKFSTVW
jgi:hypothetical protein